MAMSTSLLSKLPLEDKEYLWKQYQLQVDLYKNYLDLIVKFNVFFYAVSGGIASFCFTASAQNPMAKYALSFPIIMCLGFAWVFCYAAGLTPVVRDELFKIRDHLGLDTAPDYNVLRVLLYASAVMLAIVAFGLGVALWAWPSPSVATPIAM
jgi:hypothetical protein